MGQRTSCRDGQRRLAFRADEKHPAQIFTIDRPDLSRNTDRAGPVARMTRAAGSAGCGRSFAKVVDKIQDGEIVN